PALCLAPLDPAYLDLKVSNVRVQVVQPAPDQALYLPPGMTMADLLAAGSAVEPPHAGSAVEPSPGTGDGNAAAQSGNHPPEPETPWPGPDPTGHPVKLSEREAVLVAHAAKIDQAASYLHGGLSVLIRCDKLLVEHLATEVATRSGRVPRTVQVP